MLETNKASTLAQQDLIHEQTSNEASAYAASSSVLIGTDVAGVRRQQQHDVWQHDRQQVLRPGASVIRGCYQHKLDPRGLPVYA